MEPDQEGGCIICLDTSPPPIQMGCACRGDSGLAHIDCLVQLAESRKAQRESAAWSQCRTCKQDFTGAMRTGLAVAWWSQVAGQAESDERLAAESNLGRSLIEEGKYADAEPMLREIHKVYMRKLGAEHPDALMIAGDLAKSLCTSQRGNAGRH